MVLTLIGTQVGKISLVTKRAASWRINRDNYTMPQETERKFGPTGGWETYESEVARSSDQYALQNDGMVKQTKSPLSMWVQTTEKRRATLHEKKGN